MKKFWNIIHKMNAMSYVDVIYFLDISITDILFVVFST
jgi:hypothetical protein